MVFYALHADYNLMSVRDFLLLDQQCLATIKTRLAIIFKGICLLWVHLVPGTRSDQGTCDSLFIFS